MLSPPAVLGNIFIFMFAGHEANANTMLFVILLLACHPTTQKKLQADIDRILTKGRMNADTPDAYSYESLYDQLSNSMVGAVINGALRLFSVLPFLPKCVPPGSSPQPLKLSNDRTHMIPANTLILINTSAIHRHPQYWPRPGPDPDRGSAIDDPVLDFNPGFWLEGQSDHGEKSGRDPTTGFLHPAPGTFVPFSDGARDCIGKKFAIVELVAMVIRIFREHSVELAVADGAPLDDFASRAAAWATARASAERELGEGIEFKMSLRLAGKVPVCFVKRGEEQFADVADSR